MQREFISSVIFPMFVLKVWSTNVQRASGTVECCACAVHWIFGHENNSWRAKKNKKKYKNKKLQKEIEAKCEICCFYLKFGQIWRDKCWKNDTKISIKKCHFLVHYLWRELLDQETPKCNCREFNIEFKEGKICLKPLLLSNQSHNNAGKISSWFWLTIILSTLEFRKTCIDHSENISSFFLLNSQIIIIYSYW